MISSTRLSDVADYKKHHWIWWAFSLYYFIPAFYIPFSLLEQVLNLTAYAAFIGLSTWATFIDRNHAWRPIGLLMVLATVTSYLTPGASSFFPYIGFFICFYFSARRFIFWLTGILPAILIIHLTNRYPAPYFLFPAVTGLLTVGMVGIVERVRLDAKLREQQSHQEIRQLAMIAERERIARDLHDILGHTLSSVVLKAELADKLLQQNQVDEARSHMQDLHHMARESLSLVRQTVSGYKHRGLPNEIFYLCEKLRERGFMVELHGEIPRVSAKEETALILALTELTTNILRHSEGNHCALAFTETEGQLKLTISDNGRISSLTPGNGLQGIQERLHTLAGELDINIESDCRFTISLPIHAQEPNAS